MFISPSKNILHVLGARPTIVFFQIVEHTISSHGLIITRTFEAVASLTSNIKSEWCRVSNRAAKIIEDHQHERWGDVESFASLVPVRPRLWRYAVPKRPAPPSPTGTVVGGRLYWKWFQLSFAPFGPAKLSKGPEWLRCS